MFRSDIMSNLQERCKNSAGHSRVAFTQTLPTLPFYPIRFIYKDGADGLKN